MAFVGVYDALQKKYLKTLLFCICEAVDGPMIEEYACKVSMNSITSRRIKFKQLVRYYFSPERLCCAKK